MPYTPLNLKKTADRISQFGRDSLKIAVQNKIDIYNDNWKDQLLQELRGQFSLKTWERLKLLASIEFNIFKRVINMTSMVYKNPAMRRALLPTTEKPVEGVKVAPKEDQNYSDMIGASDINAVMPQVNRMVNATNQVLVRPVVRDGRMEVDMFTFSNAEIIVDPDDWKRIIGVKFYTGQSLPINYTYDETVADKKADEKPTSKATDINQSAVSDYDKAIIFLLENKDAKGKYQDCMVYTMVNKNGVEYSETPPEKCDYKDKDGRPVIPFLLFWREYPTLELLDFTTGNDLLDANMTFAMDMTHLRYLKKFQSYKVMTWRTRDKSKMPNTITIDPGSLTVEEDSEGSGNTGLEVIDLQADIKSFWETNKDTLTTFLTNYNISPENFTMSGNPQSGFAAKISREGQMEARQAQIPVYRERETALFNVMRIVWNTDEPTKKISEDAKFDINFGEIDVPMSADEEMKQDTFDIQNNVITPIDIIQRNDPDLDEKEAVEKYLKNKAFNSSQRGTLTPPEQPGNGVTEPDNT